MSSSIAQEQQRKYVKRRSESGMKKYLIAVLLTACLLFSFGTTAFADPSGGQTPNTDGASNSVTQNEETYTITYVDGVGNTFQTNTYNKSVTTTVIEDIPT